MSIREMEIDDKINIPAEEAYKVLRTNIQFCALDGNLKTIAMTIAHANEGKTTTCINLAVSVANDSKKVLYVDADMRKSIHVRDINNSATKGLSNYLSHMAEFDEIVKVTNIENLYMVSCGVRPPNAAELLGTNRFKEFLQEAADKFDFVIIDTPPLGSVIDCAIIASHTDGVVLVVKRKTADYHKILRVKQQLEKVNARILGVVLNKIDKGDYKYYYKYYRYDDQSNKKYLKKLKKRKDNIAI